MISELEKIYDELEKLDDLDEDAEFLATEIKRSYQEKVEETINDEEKFNSFFTDLLKYDDQMLEEFVDKLAMVNLYAQIEDLEVADYEKVYLSMVDTLLELSKTVDPLRGFNKARLTSALELIRDFEERYWPLSTRITLNNIEAFDDFIPPQHYEDVFHNRKHAIGALRHVGDDTFAAGVIIYEIPYVDEDEAPVINIDWVYVHDSLRQSGVGNFLMALVLDMALQNEGSVVTTELFVKDSMDEYEQYQWDILGEYLDSWKFEFNLNTGAMFATKISELKDNKFLEGSTAPVKSLSALGKDGPKLLQEFFKDCPKGTSADMADLPYEHFDENLSCVLLEDKKIKSVFLLNVIPGGDIRYELLKTLDSKNPADMLKLMAFSYQKCIENGYGDKMLYGRFTTEEGFELAKKIMPDAGVPLLQQGFLVAQPTEISNETWDALRKEAGFSDDKIPEDEFALNDENMTDEEYETLKEFLTERG